MEADISFATVEGGKENREAVLLGKLTPLNLKDRL